MNQRNAPTPHFFISKTNLLRISIAIAFAALLVVPLFKVSSASRSQKSSSGDRSSVAATSSRRAAGIVNPVAPRELVNTFMPFLPQAQFMPESVATYAADCTTPKVTFLAGETVCAVASGTFLRPGRIYWVNSQGDALETDIISAASPTATWIVTETGNWKVYLDDFDSLRALARFTVSDPQLPKVDLSVQNSIAGSDVVAGAVVEYEVSLINNGPDTAAAVVLTQTIPNDAVLLSSSQDSGPVATCTDSAIDTTCELGSLASGSSAVFTFIYQLNTGVPTGTLITNTATIASTTSELFAPDNTSVAEATTAAGAAAESCTLDCPNDITTASNATQGGVAGAFVTFEGAEGFGTCGTISSSHASGSFFPEGSTTVLVTSSEGGGGCSFTVNVIAEGAPSITCPADMVVTAPANSSEATVDPGTPTTNPTTGVSVSGVRNDSQALNAPYPVGTTLITWTATATSGLSSSCTQRIVVNSDACGTDTEPPSITAPNDVTVTTPADTIGSCGFVVGESALGSAEATDNCSVTFARTGVPAGNFFPVGTTTITYTATDGAGLQATDTQTVTVIDGSAPLIEAPADATYVCPSEVPAANPSQATRPEFDPNGNQLPPGPPLDNCGTPTVTVNESNNGGAGSTSSPLIITRVFTATDAAGNSSSDTQTITVADGEAPTITAPADATFQCATDVPTGGAGDATASDNCAAPTVTFSESSNGGAGTSANPLVITRTYTATDAAGNTASDSQTITVVDDTAPTITAPADATFQCASDVPTGGAGDATASDNCAAPTVTYSESSSGAGSTASPLVITRTYTATDAAGNTASDSQTITVVDDTAPTITAPADATFQCASDVPTGGAGDATASDNCAAPTVAYSESSSGAGSTASPLVITRTYTATDAAGNTASDSQTITVIDDTAPTIALTGANPQVVECHTSYSELGATATDNCSGSFAATPSGSVNVNTPGTYTITYNASDAAGNAAAAVTRTVTVVDTTAPVITRNGPASVTVECHTSYTDAGATAADSCDTNVPVTPSGSVNVNSVGTYTLTYNATDDSGNPAAPVTRIVTVVDTTAPTITLNSYAPSMWPPNHKYQTFLLTSFVTGASDSCGTGLGLSDVVIEKVTSDEIENGNGDGNTLNDIVIAADCKSVQLRREREGGGNGRVYTITFKVIDASGNVGRATATVVVPHNNGSTAVDSGIHYTVNGNCP